MIHKIDGKVFAVGVLDFTHEALSSVYLYYDPDFEFISPGTLCALREIEYCQKVRQDYDQSFRFYYLGLYF
jgi:arginine-tRNA-protein transferase